MWEYLKASGALDKGEEAIVAAKKQWKKIYNTRYKAEQRKFKSLHVVNLLPVEKERLEINARKLGIGVTEYIKKSAIAYGDLTYVIHDPATVRKIEAMLVRSLSALEEISRGEKKKGWFSSINELDDAKKIVDTLRADVMRELTKPDLLMTTIKNSPQKWQDILNLINDSKEHRS